MTEKELVKKLQQADQLTFKYFVDQYQNKVLNTCWGFVKNSSEAEDLTQEVFIEIFESIQDFKHESRLSTYVYRIAVNKSLDYIRKQKRQKRWGNFLSIMGWSDSSEMPDIPTWEHPGVTLENKERASILIKQVETLPEKQRVVFNLRYYDEMPYEEMATVLNTSEGALKASYHHAVKKVETFIKNG